MRPMTFINGVILGSAAALAGVLGVILIFRLALISDHSLDQVVVRSDLPLGELLHDMLIFAALTLFSGLAFWGQLMQKRWRWLTECALAVAVAAVLIYFLASAENRVRDFWFLGVITVLGASVAALAWYSGLLSRLWSWLEDEG